MKLVTVRPAIKGAIVRDTDGSILPQEGKPVPLSTYWSRRLKDNDVVFIKEDITTGNKSMQKPNTGGK